MRHLWRQTYSCRWHRFYLKGPMKSYFLILVAICFIYNQYINMFSGKGEINQHWKLVALEVSHNMASISVNIGNWTWKRAAEIYTKQTMLNFLEILSANKTITDLCSNYQYTCLAHILNVHFKIIIMWFLICK